MAISNYASGLYTLGHFREAIEMLSRALKLKPNDTTLICNKGVAHAQLKNFDEAMKCFNMALTLDRNSTLALVNKGRVYTEQGDSKRALVCVNIAISIDPKCEDAVYNRALILNSQNDLEESIRNFKKISPQQESAQVFWHERGIVFLKMNQLDDAIECLDKCMSIRDDTYQYIDALLMKARILSRMQRHKEAIVLYEKVIGMKKADQETLTNAYLYMGTSFYYLKNYGQALDKLQKGLEIDSQVASLQANLYSTCAVSMTHLKRFVLKEFFFFFFPVLNLFNSFEKCANRYEEAVVYLQRAIQLTDKNSPEFNEIRERRDQANAFKSSNQLIFILF